MESISKQRGVTVPTKSTTPFKCLGENWDVVSRIFEETVWEQVKGSAKSFSVDTCSQVTVLGSASASHYNAGIKIGNVVCEFKFNFNYSLSMQKRRNIYPVNSDFVTDCAARVQADIKAKKQKKRERVNKIEQAQLEEQTDLSKSVISLESAITDSSMIDEEDQRPYITLPTIDAYYSEAPTITMTHSTESSTQTNDVTEEEPVRIITKPKIDAAFYESHAPIITHVSDSYVETDDQGNQVYRNPIIEPEFGHASYSMESNTSSDENDQEPKYITLPAIEPVANVYNNYETTTYSESYFDCNSDLKKKIIRIFFALANKRLFKSLVIYQENIIDCSWHKDATLYYDIQLSLNNEVCLYRVQVDGLNNFELLNHADVLSGSCKQNLTWEYLTDLSSRA